MSVKFFILGRPGSGKSTAARHIRTLLRIRDCSCIRINDYKILKKMYEAEREHQRFDRFRPIDNNGFDIIDFEVLNQALERVRNLAEKHTSSADYDLVIIEFARADYSVAMQIFKPDFLRDAYFLFLDADLDTCIQRVHQRIRHPVTKDDNFISDEMIRNYYDKDNRLYMMSTLAAEYNLDNKQIKIFENVGPLQDFIAIVDEFIEFILNRVNLKLQETDPIQVVPTLISDSELAK